MKYEIAPIGAGASRVVLRGRADAAGVDGIEAELGTRLRETAGHVVVDLADVPFMGSLGIRMLIAIARMAGRRGARIAMTGVQPQVLAVFETMALTDLIPHAPDEAAALALLEG
ncbi:MAG: STAS domain-containing protein [Acetobacteraceae bacterium]|nr:STAS domain-containing protein [Acetobacteraceae bacterium]